MLHLRSLPRLTRRAAPKSYQDEANHDPRNKTRCNELFAVLRHVQHLPSNGEIMLKLDADDVACLQHLDRHNKQVWAQLLADRFTRKVKKIMLEMVSDTK